MGLGILFLALILWGQFQVRWWVALLAAFFGPIVIQSAIAVFWENAKAKRTCKGSAFAARGAVPRSSAEHYIREAAQSLHDGFPLARVSQDVTPSGCPVCSRLEGRLVDLTPTQSFRDIAIPLLDLVKSGIWHDDCVHRLEYISALELPNAILRRLGKDYGEEGAFGRYSADDLRALVQLAANAQRRAEATLRRQAVAACGERFTCSICERTLPIDALSSVNGYLNDPHNLEFVCEDCESKASAKGKTYAWRPLPEE